MPKISEYVKTFNDKKSVPFHIYDELLEKYKSI